MKRIVYTLFVGVSISSFAHGNLPSWVLVYSAEDEFCQHMLKRVNDDAVENGTIDPSRYPEVQALEWSSDNQIMDFHGLKRLSDTSRQNRLSIADVNNDGVDDIAHIWEPINLGGAGDYKVFFNFYSVTYLDKINRGGIQSNELFLQTLGEPIYQAEGLYNYRGGPLYLANLPVQGKREAISGQFSDSYMYISQQSFLHPIFYNKKFYVSLLGKNIRNYPFENGKKYIIRKYSKENRVMDVCYFFDVS